MRTGIILDNELNSDIRVLREIGILKEHGHELFVLCFGFRKKYESPLPGVSVERINIPGKIKDTLFFLLNTIPFYEWMWAFRIKKFILRNNLEVVHAHDLYMSKASYRGIKRSGKRIPLILDLHENYPFTVQTYNWTKGFFRSRISKPRTWTVKEQEYMNYADRVIVLSADFKELLLKRYPHMKEENFYVVPNVPDLTVRLSGTIEKAENPFINGFPVILYYGVIAERRGIFDAITAFSELVKQNSAVNFLFIGPVDKKDQERFNEQMECNDLDGRICHIPWINAADLPSYLSISDICIAPFHKNPQHESGVANKIYDYMLGAKPLIVSDCKPQMELVERHSCGLVFSDIPGMKEAIIKLVSDSDLRIVMGKNGYEAVMRYYNMGILKSGLLGLYDSLHSENQVKTN